MAAEIPPPPPPPPPPPTYPAAAGGPPVRDAGPTPAGPGSLASMAQRIGARAIDLLVWFAVAAVLVGVEAVVRAIAGVEEPAADATDAIDTVLGLLLLLLIVAYDPLTTALWGATIGKRALGLQVVSSDDGAPASTGAIVARHVLQLILWSLCVTGVLDLVAGARDPGGRTWHDRAASTAVVRAPRRGGRHPTPVPAAAHLLPPPWSDLLAEAEAARHRLDHSIAVTMAGPVREHLHDARRRIDECVERCADVAARGARLQAIAGGVDVEAVRRRYQAALAERERHPDDPGAARLAEAVAGELASAERLHDLVVQTERSLRRLVSQLNDAVNRAAAVAFAPDGEGFEVVVDQLESLRQSLAEVQASASLDGR